MKKDYLSPKVDVLIFYDTRSVLTGSNEAEFTDIWATLGQGIL